MDDIFFFLSGWIAAVIYVKRSLFWSKRVLFMQNSKLKDEIFSPCFLFEQLYSVPGIRLSYKTTLHLVKIFFWWCGSKEDCFFGWCTWLVLSEILNLTIDGSFLWTNFFFKMRNLIKTDIFVQKWLFWQMVKNVPTIEFQINV